MSAAQQAGHDWVRAALRAPRLPRFSVIEDPPPLHAQRATYMPTEYEPFRSKPPTVAPTDPAPKGPSTLPPSAEEVEAAFRESQRAPRMQTEHTGESDLAKLTRTVGEFALEARTGRGEIMDELRSVAREVAGIRHEATRMNQRLSGLEQAFGLTRDDVDKLKRQLRRALRRIEALEAAQKVTRVTEPAPPETA